MTILLQGQSLSIPAEGGAADYTRGFVAYLVDDEGNVSEAIENGGTASFDYAENTLDYVAGTSEAVHTVYLSSYGITKKEPEEAVKETVPGTVSGQRYGR